MLSALVLLVGRGCSKPAVLNVARKRLHIAARVFLALALSARGCSTRGIPAREFPTKNFRWWKKRCSMPFARGFHQRTSDDAASGALCLSPGAFSKGLPMMEQPVLYAFRQNVDSVSMRTYTSTTAYFAIRKMSADGSCVDELCVWTMFADLETHQQMVLIGYFGSTYPFAAYVIAPTTVHRRHSSKSALMFAERTWAEKPPQWLE